MSEFTAEIIGTMFLILLGNGVVANVVLTGTKGHNSGWIVITTGWALGVFAGVVIAGPYSGAHLNPAVTIALAIAGKFSWVKVPMYILAQFIGAMLGALLVWLMYKDHFYATKDPGSKAAVFCTSPAIKNIVNNLVSEVIGTFVLLFVKQNTNRFRVIGCAAGCLIGMGHWFVFRRYNRLCH
jgi:glycerol uptake facilitator protein